jgi:hypothetical protein
VVTKRVLEVCMSRNLDPNPLTDGIV